MKFTTLGHHQEGLRPPPRVDGAKIVQPTRQTARRTTQCPGTRGLVDEVMAAAVTTVVVLHEALPETTWMMNEKALERDPEGENECCAHAITSDPALIFLLIIYNIVGSISRRMEVHVIVSPVLSY